MDPVCLMTLDAFRLAFLNWLPDAEAHAMQERLIAAGYGLSQLSDVPDSAYWAALSPEWQAVFSSSAWGMFLGAMRAHWHEPGAAEAKAAEWLRGEVGGLPFSVNKPDLFRNVRPLLRPKPEVPEEALADWARLTFTVRGPDAAAVLSVELEGYVETLAAYYTTFDVLTETVRSFRGLNVSVDVAALTLRNQSGYTHTIR